MEKLFLDVAAELQKLFEIGGLPELVTFDQETELEAIVYQGDPYYTVLTCVFSIVT